MSGQTTIQSQTATKPTVTPIASGVLQRQCACGQHTSAGGECEECKKKREGLLQRAAIRPSPVSEVPPIVHDVLRSPGRSLDTATRGFMEQRFGHDFSGVRIHTDAKAAESAHTVNAFAYTVGRDVVFGAGRYAPGMTEGIRLLAHELTHVVQQSGQSPLIQTALQLGEINSSQELEANNASKNIVAGKAARVQGHANISLQGAWDWGRAGIGALTGGILGAGLGAFGGPIGALIGLGAGALVGGLIGGLTGREQITEVQRQCNLLMDRIRQHPVYRALAAGARALADDIITLARQRDNCLYYAEKLKLLLDTPEAPPAVSGQATPQGSTLERNRQAVDQAAQQERARLATPEAQQEVGRQEQSANDPARHWTERRGKNDKIFYVDRSDPNHIVARIKVRLLAAGGVTTSQDIANEMLLEDAIERVAETRGYTIDVIFVDHDGHDVFTFNVDFDKWPTSANPVGNARTLAHEIHHLMGLDDRYDYIESHAANRNMDIPTRLHWFRRQMDRQPDPNKDVSLMGRGGTMLDDDVCRVAGLDLQSCMAARAHGAAQPQ